MPRPAAVRTICTVVMLLSFTGYVAASEADATDFCAKIKHSFKQIYFSHTHPDDVTYLKKMNFPPWSGVAMFGSRQQVLGTVRSRTDARVADEMLNSAAYVGNLENVKLLIEEGVDPDGKAAASGPPVAVAASCGHANVVAYLIGHGADMYLKRVNTSDAMLAAMVERSGATIEVLLQKGFDACRGYPGKSKDVLIAAARRTGNEVFIPRLTCK
jgi:hypothetical protein